MHAALVLLLLPAPTGSTPPREPLVLDYRITAVTVHPSGASVVRRAEVPAGDRTVTISGLPAGVRADDVRVRAEGLEVVGVDVRARTVERAPDGRREALRDALREAQHTLQQRQDEQAVQQALADWLEQLATVSGQETTPAPSASPGSWEREAAWLDERLPAAQADLLAAGTKVREAQLAVDRAKQALDGADVGGAVPVVDVLVDEQDLDGGGGALEVEYRVGGASWQPAYELRADRALDSVALVFRARVTQKTGEDWDDVAVTLSTSEPHRGAAGPEPGPIWVSAETARPESRRAVAGRDARLATRERAKFAAQDKVPAEEPAETAVEEAGTSVLYHLPRRETLVSRDAPTTVLVGDASLAARPEHVCIPAQDPTVWLRALATNTSPWTLPAGEATVFFGADFLGGSRLDAVRPGQEITLHLGPDPGLEVERAKLAEKTEGPGFFGSKRTLRTEWRLRVTNHGGLSERPDGTVQVVLQEAVPRTRDSRVSVSLDDAKPAPSKDERWALLRQEHGVASWVVDVPKGGERVVEFAVEIAYPRSLELVGR